MSIDGPGVLESDLGHDVYNDILDMYDSGLAVSSIRERLTSIESELTDDLEQEIFLAAAAKSFWDIGHAQEDLQVRLTDLLASGRSAAQWERAAGAKVAKARALVLTRLLGQVRSARVKPRPRKKYASVGRKLFRVGDCLLLDLPGEVHRGVVGKILEHRGTCEYAVLVMEKGTASSVEAIANGRYYGRRIPSYGSESGFALGPHVIRLDHRMLLREGNPFVVVGNVPLDEQRFMLGSFGGVLNIGDVIDDFNRTERNSGGMSNDLLPMFDLIDKASDAAAH
jgi:hypothetical protein